MARRMFPLIVALTLSTGVAFGQQPDRAKIAFRSWNVTSGIWMMNLDGTARDLIIEAGLNPSWSLKEKIAYVTINGASSTLWTSTWDGKGQKRVLDLDGYIGRTAWSPDGKRIAFEFKSFPLDEALGNQQDIYIVDVDGSNRFNVMNNPDAENAHPSWSPEGPQIAYRGRQF